MTDTITQRTAHTLFEEIVNRKLDFEAAWDLILANYERAPQTDEDDVDSPFIVEGLYLRADRNTMVFNDGSVLTCHEMRSGSGDLSVVAYPTLLHAQQGGIITVEDDDNIDERKIQQVLAQLHEDEIALLRNYFQRESSDG